MAKRHRENYRQHNILYTVVTVLVLCAIFLSMVGHLYTTAREEAYEDLHVQTKQIKDDITLQMISDRENLTTMANFAAKLYGDGESYGLMFASFKPIGLIANIGILNPDNTLVTKMGMVDLNGSISFEEEKAKGAYVSGRTPDLINAEIELIRSAVPIVCDGQTVGILYGVIRLDALGERYKTMAQEFDAQLFVYEQQGGELVVDTVHTTLGNISFLKDRVYNEGYSYEEMAANDQGFTSFASAYKDENMHLHYSTIEDLGWMIAMARYDSQVFAETHLVTRILFVSFLVMAVAVSVYILLLVVGERRRNAVTDCASNVRKELLETAGGQNNIHDALGVFCGFVNADMLILYDDNGADHSYTLNENRNLRLQKADRRTLKSVLSRYVAERYGESKEKIIVMCIKADKWLQKNDADFYAFLERYEIAEISFVAVVDSTTHTTVLAVCNPKSGKAARSLGKKVAACFSMALYNKKQLEETEIAATIDALTGLFNNDTYIERVAELNKEQAADVSCVFVDVNGLHLCNNRYGHAAGDEMLRYIADALKGEFKGHTLFRLGGDEFLVLAKNTAPSVIEQSVQRFREKLAIGKYSAAIGMSYCAQNTDTAALVKEAEVKMYKEKEAYYQDKRERSFAPSSNCEYVQVSTGIAEIDMMISVMKEKYSGIYRVALETDQARCILMPAYLGYSEQENCFSELFLSYAAEMVESDYHRNLTNLMHYDSLKKQLLAGETPRVSYTKNNGERMVLSVYKLGEFDDPAFNTLWVFAKE